MKIFRAELEEIIGMLVGAVFWYLWTFVIIAINFRISIPNQRITWVNVGLLVFFIISEHYILSNEIIDEEKRIEDRIGLKSNLIGYFL